MSKLKYFFLNRLSGSLGLGLLSIVFTQRLKGLVTRPVHLKVKSYFSINDLEITEQDLVIITRILKFWKHSKTEVSLSGMGGTPWIQIQKEQSQFYKLLDGGDLEAIYKYLVSSPTHSICNGVLQGDKETKMMKVNPKYKALKSKITINRFISLTEAIGNGRDVQNPEQGPWGIKKDYDFDESLCHLDTEFGMAVIPPTIFSGLLVTTIGNRSFNQVDIMAIAASLRIKNTLIDSPNKSVLEIGSGSGTTPYWCNRLGLGPIQLIDLPHVAILQAFYLLKSLPEANILLYGEEPNEDQADITIYPHWAFNELPKIKIGVCFNQDSFAEMSNEAVSDYLRWMSMIDAQFLLSTNHESSAVYDSALQSQINISRLVKKNSAYSPVSRNLNWIRQGYIDQVWKIH
jgi:hypothetical protein